MFCFRFVGVMGELVINFEWIDIGVDEEDGWEYKYLVEIIDPDYGLLEVNKDFSPAVAEYRAIMISAGVSSCFSFPLNSTVILLFQQLSYFMADQNTAVEQVCTLGAIREETGPALSDDENARYR